MKKIKLAVGAVVLLAVVAAAVFLINRGGMFASYDATVPTQQKFESMEKWIAPDADVWFTADIWQVLKNPVLAESVRTYLRERHGLAADLVESVLMGEGGVGMVSVMANVQNADAKPVAAIVIQGNFDSNKLAESVKNLLKSEGDEIAEEKIADKTVFYEKAADPFGFMFLDANHMAIGSKASLVEFFSKAPYAAVDVGPKPLPLVFGKISLSDRLRPLLPPELADISDITLASEDGAMVTAAVHCQSAEKASSVRMFLEGMRSLMMINNKGLPLASMLERVKVSSDGGDVYVTASSADLFGIR